MMEIIHSFRLTNGLCSFSPNGLLVAICYHQRITVYLLSEFRQIRIIQCPEAVEYLEWSADSELILTAYLKKGKLDIWSLIQSEWKCKISTGGLGLVAAQFAPSSRHVLTTSSLHLRITIWCLYNQTVSHINLPKESNPGIDFSPGGCYMAVVERRMAQDCVGIYASDTWTQITVIDGDFVDIGGVKWSPDGMKIAIWDGSHSGKLSIYLISGSKLAELTDIFGIHNIEWGPSAQILAVSIAGSKVKLINHLSWHPISTLSHSRKIRDTETIIYSESETSPKYGIILQRPFELPGELGCIGKLKFAFSADARYLAVLDQQRPSVLWIWEIPFFSLKSVLVHRTSIKCFKWRCTDPQLAIVCGTGLVYSWTPLGCAVSDVGSPTSHPILFKADQIAWDVSGKHLMISSKEFSCIYEVK